MLYVHDDGERVEIDPGHPEARRYDADDRWTAHPDTPTAPAPRRRGRGGRTAPEPPPSVDEDAVEPPEADPADPDGA